MARGRLRIYLGAAPGVGKTYSMLAEGQRRRSRGTDVVIGVVEPHGRRLTAAMAEALEEVPRRTCDYRQTRFTEMDLDAVLARNPQVALVDELAHTNVPGCRNAKRWQDVEELLDAGIDVVTTLNIQHLESLNDVVRQITGVTQHETLPDSVARAAEQVELVDMTPEALRRRMVHGNVYPPDRIEAALTHYFRPGNLTALRELALLWLADRVEEGLQRYRAEHGIGTGWETRERILVALSGGPEGETLVRRAARIAERTRGAHLLAVHVLPCDGLAERNDLALAGQRALVESLGGRYCQVVGSDVAEAVIEFARAENTTQIVLGSSRRAWPMSALTGEGVGARVTRLSGPIDVHIVTHEHAAGPPKLRLPRAGGRASLRRHLAGAALAVLALAGLTATGLQGRYTLPSVLLCYLPAVVAVAAVAGFSLAMATALAGALCAGYLYAAVTGAGDLVAMAAFVAVATLVSWAIDRTGRHARRAARASAEASALSALAGAAWGRPDLAAQLEQIRQLFGLRAVSLLYRQPAGGTAQRWQVMASAGERPPEQPGEADTSVPAGPALTLAGRGRALSDSDQRVLVACAAQIAIGQERQELAAHAADADQRIVTDRAQTVALLAAQRELQAPLQHLQETLGRLATPESSDAGQRRELAAVGQASLARLDAVITDLHHLGQARAGALDIHLRPVELDAILPAVLDDLGPGGHDIVVDAPEDLPDVITDANLLTRAVTTLAANALERSPDHTPATMTVTAQPEHLTITIVDHGGQQPPAEPGRPATAAAGEPIDLDPARSLPVSTARALIEAIGGAAQCHATPGGGLTVTATLPRTARP
ncbi:universal stress protein [Dactylosporangium sp. AC04546]|uniref:universal stress protein n=1 Tax=Dactylosporangium sp. AC04546 TaxID=2862460 RepID=UPI001EE1118E|nr:universal stress protein [Dactylosporangium sp. AC04546]WVK78617.1 universal stress protein [Dactylosporangium sp. AC04546]